MKFTKEYFEKHGATDNEFRLDELIDMDGTPIEGDFTPSYGDIQTGPVAKSFNDNSDYEKGQLKNPVNDAKLIAKTLDSLGFDVIAKYKIF
jgi:hypothetical protein